MRLCVPLLGLWIVWSSPAPADVITSNERPNLILILADDLGAEDCGPFGNKGVRTPNLDRLAREGLRFDQAFLTCSSCSPSRASLITGRYPHATGAMQLHESLPAEQATFVRALKEAGYHTGGAGKWHLGPHAKPDFDDFREGGGPSGCERWVSVLKDRPKDRPFFMWLAAVDPHRDYQDGAIDPPHLPEVVTVPPYLPDTDEVRKDLARYYDEIQRMDRYIGGVLDELDRQGVAENTMVVFLSDNGRPFPRCKTTVYDSGIRTPMIARWPGRIRAGGVSASLVSTVDIAPTLLEAAGVAGLSTFQGRSFARILDDPAAEYRDFVFSEHNWHDFDDHQRAVRSSRWKYIRTAYTDVPQTPPADAMRSPTFQVMRRLRDAQALTDEQRRCFEIPRPADELYDLESDPHELKNLANDPAHADTRNRLREVLNDWIETTRDSIPKMRTPDGFDRETGEALPKPGRSGG